MQRKLGPAWPSPGKTGYALTAISPQEYGLGANSPLGQEAHGEAAPQEGARQQEPPPASSQTGQGTNEEAVLPPGTQPQGPPPAAAQAQEAPMVVTKTKAPFLHSRSSQRLRRQEAMMRDTHYDGGPTDEQMLTIVAPWE